MKGDINFKYTEALLSRIRRQAAVLGRTVKIMEVCGTHTVNLRKFGIHSLLPENIKLVSGPGCPVCVTPAGYIDNALSLLSRSDVLIATFGDMLKVPGTDGNSLAQFPQRVKIMYSPTELLELDTKQPVVFLGIGFETTIPMIASVFLHARAKQRKNILLYPAFKTIVPALKTLLASKDLDIDGFLLPGHVSVVIGAQAYQSLNDSGGLTGVITGFEAHDLLWGIFKLLELLEHKTKQVFNAYSRAVSLKGNPRAQEVIARLLEPCDEVWRGLGIIPQSGLRLRRDYVELDAVKKFDLPVIADTKSGGCLCHLVIQGKTIPTSCPHFGSSCRPETPVGPCMVSSEGTCAAYFKYGETL